MSDKDTIPTMSDKDTTPTMPDKDAIPTKTSCLIKTPIAMPECTIPFPMSDKDTKLNARIFHGCVISFDTKLNARIPYFHGYAISLVGKLSA